MSEKKYWVDSYTNMGGDSEGEFEFIFTLEKKNKIYPYKEAIFYQKGFSCKRGEGDMIGCVLENGFVGEMKRLATYGSSDAFDFTDIRNLDDFSGLIVRQIFSSYISDCPYDEMVFTIKEASSGREIVKRVTSYLINKVD